MIKMSVQVNIDGLDVALEEIVTAINGNLDAVATQVETEARSSAAFIDKTGNLRKSIKKRKSKFTDGGYIVEASGRGKSKGYHAANVEFGHVMIAWGNPTGKRVPAHPFLRPAVEKAFKVAVQLFRIT